MPRNYKQIIDRLGKIKQQIQPQANAIIIVDELPDGRYMRIFQDRSSSFWNFENQPPGSTVNINSLFVNNTIYNN